MTERSSGVPLFIEEVTRPPLERGEQGGIQAIPLTLAAVVDGTALSARAGARSGADRRRDRTRLLLHTAARRSRNRGPAAADCRWTGSPKPISCWGRACRPNPIIASSMR